MRPISRSAALTMDGAGLLSTVVGGTGLWRELSTSVPDPVAGETFTEPDVVRSDSGLLEVRLEAAVGTHEIAGRQAMTMGYNGGVPGPTLRLRAGDTLRVELVNRLVQVTNLHVHGLHVSREGSGDNVFLAVEPGGLQRYEYPLPDDHPPGVYGELVLLNGQTRPDLQGRAGERERWRVINACTSRYLALSLPGQSARVVGRDVGRLASPVELEDVVLAPGNRLDVVVDLAEGTSELAASPVGRGGMMGPLMGWRSDAGRRWPGERPRTQARSRSASRSRTSAAAPSTTATSSTTRTAG